MIEQIILIAIGDMKERGMNAKEYAEYLGVPTQTFYDWLHRRTEMKLSAYLYLCFCLEGRVPELKIN